MELINKDVFYLFWEFGALLTYAIFAWNRRNKLLSLIHHADDLSFLMWMTTNLIAWPLILAIILIIVSVTWIKDQYQKRIRHPDE